MLNTQPSFSVQTNWDRFNPGPMFRLALRCRKKVIALEGAVGTGKSSIFCLFLAWHCAENPGAVWVVIRSTYKMLKDNTIKGTWLKWFPDNEAGYLDGEENFHLDCMMFGKRAIGEIRFRPAEREEDISRFMGGEYAGAVLDECTGTYKEMGLPEDVYTGLLGRLRQPGMTRRHLILAFNPPPPGHWVAHEFPLPPVQDDELRGHFVIPPAENKPNLPENYYEDLFKLWKAKEDWSSRFLKGERVPIGKANSVFDKQSIMAALDDWAKDPITQGILKRDEQTRRVTLDRVSDAPLRIWEFPNSGTYWVCEACMGQVSMNTPPADPSTTDLDCPRCGGVLTCKPRRHIQDRYVIGADSASGLSDGDASCVLVKSRRTGNLVAEWHGHISPKAFAKEIAMLGWYYNEAFVVPEVEPSADGRSTCDALENLGYGNIYQQRREQNIGDPIVRRLGLPMSRFNKVRLVGAAREWWKDKFGKIPVRELLLELLNFVQHPDHSLAADKGCEDHRVLAWFCTLEGFDREGIFVPKRSDGEIDREVEELVERYHGTGGGGDDRGWMAS